VEIHYERKKNEASILKEIERQQLRLRLQRDEMTGAYNRKALHDAAGYGK
jgi:diguanylate cyclase